MSVVVVVSGADEVVGHGVTEEDGVHLVVIFVEGAVQEIGATSGGAEVRRRCASGNARGIVIRVGISGVIELVVVVVRVGGVVLIVRCMNEDARLL